MLSLAGINQQGRCLFINQASWCLNDVQPRPADTGPDPCPGTVCLACASASTRLSHTQSLPDIVIYSAAHCAPQLAQRLLPVPQLHLQDVLQRGARLPAHMCTGVSLLSRDMHLSSKLFLPLVQNGTGKNQQLPSRSMGYLGRCMICMQAHSRTCHTAHERLNYRRTSIE